MSKRVSSLLSLSQDRDENIVVEEYRGLACLLVKVDDDWRAEKIVTDAYEGVEWILPNIQFPSTPEAVKYVRGIIDAAFPRERFGEQIAPVE